MILTLVMMMNDLDHRILFFTSIPHFKYKFLYYHHVFPHLRACNRPIQRPASSWLGSFTSGARRWHCRGQGSNPQRERPEKFRPFSLLPKQCKKCNNEVHSLSFLLLMLLLLLLLLLLLIIIIIIIIISGGSGSRSIVSIREF